MRDLFKSRGGCVESFRQIIHVCGQKIDPSQHSRLGMQQTRLIQNRDRLIQMPVIHFKLCKLKQSGCDRRGFGTGASQIGK